MNTYTSGYISSSSNGSSINDKYLHMKQFINIALEYNRTRSEASANQLNRHLQIIGAVIDLSTFDPHSSVVSEFYVSLHELMSNLESRSTLLWSGVNVLQQACKNRAAHQALIHTYHFLPILSRLLGDHLVKEKKNCLLKLMQELTYGIHITWQEPHIAPLINILVKWISTSNDNNIINLSFGVLINLCYKNLPAIYTLMRSTDTKSFIRTVFTLEGANVDIQAYKLLIILESINGELSTKDVLKFLTVAFETVINAFRESNVVQLRHIVDFFIDVKCQQNQREAFKLFTNYRQYIEKLVEVVSNENENDVKVNDPECLAMLFEFLLGIVQLNLPDIIPLYPKIAGITLNWVQTENVSAKALALLRSVATAKGVNREQILQPLSENLQILLVALNAGCSSDNSDIFTKINTSEFQSRLTGLFHLLCEMTRCPSLRNLVLQGLKIQAVSNIFKQLTHIVLSPQGYTDQDTFSEDSVMMYINGLSLVRELSMLNHDWHKLYIELLENRHVHVVIAYAFYLGNADVKILVFDISKTVEFPGEQIAQIFVEIQPLINSSSIANNRSFNNCAGGDFNKPTTITFDQYVPYTIMSCTQEEKLDNLIHKLEEAASRNQLTNVATSDVMELFEYKMASMGHAERAAQINLEAASKEAIHLKHHLAQMSAESSRLRQMLLHAQHTQEEIQGQLQQSEENARQTLVQLAKCKTTRSEVENQLKASQGQLQIKINEIRATEDKYQMLSNQFNDAQNQISQLQVNLNQYVEKNAELNSFIKKMEDKLNNLEKKHSEKINLLSKATERINKLTEENKTYEIICKQNEERMAQKDKDNIDLQTELEDYKTKLDTIIQISTKRSKT